MSSLREKQVAIDSWLYSLGESSCFEDDPFVVDFLYDLSLLCHTSATSAQVLLQNTTKESDVINQSATRLKHILSRLGVLPNQLNSQTQATLSSLTNIAGLLDVSVPSLENLTKAIILNQQKLNSLKSQHSLSQAQLGAILESTKSAKTIDSNLTPYRDQNAVKQTLSEEIKQFNESSDTFLDKESLYIHKTNSVKSHLRSLGLTRHLTHSALLGQKQELTETEENIRRHNRQLECFRGLPPNEDLTKERIEELRQEVADLEKQVAEAVSHALV
ncbi:hypothetical protein GEMRC1_012964 [Eukaryota sp. GEM-RC1]